MAQALDEAQRLLGQTIPADVRQRIADFAQGNTQRLAERLALLSASSFDAGRWRTRRQTCLAGTPPSSNRSWAALRHRASASRWRCTGRNTPRERSSQEADLRTASRVQNAMAALVREVIDDQRAFIDPAFAEWLRRAAPPNA